MKCESLQPNLPIYLDDVLSDEERRAVDGHLAECPLCREKMWKLQWIRHSLRGLARPEAPNDLLASIRNRVALEAKSIEKKPTVFFSEDIRRWLLMRLMPYSVGTIASVLLTFGLLWALLLPADRNVQNNEIVKLQPLEKTAVSLADTSRQINSGESMAVSLDAANFAVSGASPTINPQGALIALTKSFARGRMKDDEVVVVAEVFGSGLARIDEVVEPSRSRQAVRDLEKALQSDANYAPPFVPAHFEQGSDSVLVVLKIQSVNIDTHLKRR